MIVAWILWVIAAGGGNVYYTSPSQQAALFPTEQMCEAAATKLKEAFKPAVPRVATVCTETRIVR